MHDVKFKLISTVGHDNNTSKCHFLKVILLLYAVIVELAQVVQRLDNAMHWINHYPTDSVVCFVNIYPLDSDLSGG